MRLIVLLIEDQHPEGVSARKLVLETAKHNVISAYSGQYGLEMLRRFPAVDAVLVHARVVRPGVTDLIPELRKIRADVPIIALTPDNEIPPADADYVIASNEPHRLLAFLHEKFGADLSND